jgi:hypothetical protein
MKASLDLNGADVVVAIAAASQGAGHCYKAIAWITHDKTALQFFDGPGWRSRFLRMESEPAHVRFGSKADISGCPCDVRFTPKSGHWLSGSWCLLCAKSRHRSKKPVHNKCVHIALRWMLERGWQASNDVEP